MTILVKCFALARDLTGFSEKRFDMANGSTAGDVLSRVVADAPGLMPHAKRLAMAVNLEYVPADTALRDGDEVAIIPPVSGGST